MREVLEHMSIAQLIDTILINPTVHVAPSYRDTGLSATYTFQPLSNLVYTRDQQARAPAWRCGLRSGLRGAARLRSARPVIPLWDAHFGLMKSKLATERLRTDRQARARSYLGGRRCCGRST